jgi:hypothetical protein
MLMIKNILTMTIANVAKNKMPDNTSSNTIFFIIAIAPEPQQFYNPML